MLNDIKEFVVKVIDHHTRLPRAKVQVKLYGDSHEWKHYTDSQGIVIFMIAMELCEVYLSIDGYTEFIKLPPGVKSYEVER